MVLNLHSTSFALNSKYFFYSFQYFMTHLPTFYCTFVSSCSPVLFQMISILLKAIVSKYIALFFNFFFIYLYLRCTLYFLFSFHVAASTRVGNSLGADQPVRARMAAWKLKRKYNVHANIKKWKKNWKIMQYIWILLLLKN